VHCIKWTVLWRRFNLYHLKIKYTILYFKIPVSFGSPYVYVQCLLILSSMPALNMQRLLIVISWKQTLHLVGPIVLIYYDARSTEHEMCELSTCIWQEPSLRRQVNGPTSWKANITWRLNCWPFSVMSYWLINSCWRFEVLWCRRFGDLTVISGSFVRWRW
jgi:hypothetical protein